MQEMEEADGPSTGTPSENFPVIGKVKTFAPKPRKPPAPEWFRNFAPFEKNVTEEQHESHELNSLASTLDSVLLEKLKKSGFTRFFPVQKAVIPYVVDQLRLSRFVRPRDVCVSSPTGSGKTLAFVLPIVQHLSRTVVRDIRALIVFPVVDLALQVASVFRDLAQGTALKVGCAVGHRPFEEDLKNLLKKRSDGTHESAVDVLITTPGRLMDLIKRAPGFSLRRLQILVLDEADRLINSDLENSFLSEINKAISGQQQPSTVCVCDQQQVGNKRITYDSRTACSLFSPSEYFPPLKLLFSATLSSDPEKLQVLNLFKPKFFLATESESNNRRSDRFVTPVELEEKMVVIDQEKKPVVLRHLIENFKYRKVLCFTKSREATQHLHYMLSGTPGVKVAKVSAVAKLDVRDKLVRDFSSGAIDVIICSDILARGMDINADYVINYDPPTSDTAYVHRIGRTARGGKKGTAITLVSPTQLDAFSSIIRHVHKGDEHAVALIKIKKSALKPLLEQYRLVLQKLKKHVSRKHSQHKFRKRAALNKLA